MSVTPKASGNITGVRAVFPALIAIGRKSPATSNTDECIDRLAADLVRMRIPPCLPASSRTELLSFFSCYLFDGLSTAFAPPCPFACRAIAREPIALAIGFDGTDRHAKNFCNGRITTVFSPQFPYLYFLFSSHKGFLRSERKYPLTIPLDRFGLSGRKNVGKIQQVSKNKYPILFRCLPPT